MQPTLLQSDIYGGQSVAPLARRSDPATSRKAAAKMVKTKRISKHETAILAILRRESRALTYREMFDVATAEEKSTLREAVAIGRHLSIMQRKNLVRPGPERRCTATPGHIEAREWHLCEETKNAN